jgi:uncharacterized protein with ParB-like and HNH nuclease domain
MTTDDDAEDRAWFEDYAADDPSDFDIDEYDLTATPNDFNVLTIFNFMESGAVTVPAFQRNYVWDIKRASKLIESLILGLPVPQVFLYEEARNKFLVIDGQQRLMSVYYFLKRRFPRKEKRSELRRIFDEHGRIPEEYLGNDAYFTTFNLNLPATLPRRPSKFHRLNYNTLGDYRTQLELRPIRNIVVKQNVPKDDDSSIYEIFNRLNTGGMNLRPQEIRASLYHSDFYEALYRMNALPGWRRVLRAPEPDLHMKDVEILLRGFAMLLDLEKYTTPMAKFLNQFSKKCKAHSCNQNGYLERLFASFLDAVSELPDDTFISKAHSRFNIALFEAVFTAVCEPYFRAQATVTSAVDISAVRRLERDTEFVDASKEGTTAVQNVEQRLRRARKVLGTREDELACPAR